MEDGLRSLSALPTVDKALLIAMPGLWLGGLLPYALWCLARGGVPRTPRLEKLSKSRVVPRFLVEYGYAMLTVQVRALLALRVSADAMTYVSLLLSLVAAGYIGVGRFALGGVLMLYSFICDAFDGLIARATGTDGDRGEYLDSFVDRYIDVIACCGFLYYYRDDLLGFLLVAVGMAGTTAMSYARAKGEATGVDPNVGVMQRHERSIFLAFATVLAPVFSAWIEPGASRPRFPSVLFAMASIALLANLSAVWRAAFVLRRLPRTGPATGKPAPLAFEKTAAAGPPPADLP